MSMRAQIFNEVASLYDEIRPAYAVEVVDALVELAALPAGGRILEIGCGTGQMTVPLAARGFAILALEPGPEMAKLAAYKCRTYPRVAIRTTTFEAWPGEPEAFDLVLSAQAFHWIEPVSGCARAAAALRGGGAIALAWHIDRSEDTAFWQATLPIYVTFFPGSPDYDRDSAADGPARPSRQAIERSPAFAAPREFRHAQERTYPAADYLKLLATHSNCRALPEPDRTRFFATIEAVIRRTGGAVSRRFETLVMVARRV